ncbi:N-acetylmuramic acid 6-phosphate etherase, partial [Escherichia sp. TWPC-MK]
AINAASACSALHPVALIACERNCKTAIVMVLKNLDAAEAKKRLDQHGGFIRQVLDKE